MQSIHCNCLDGNQSYIFTRIKEETEKMLQRQYLSGFYSQERAFPPLLLGRDTHAAFPLSLPSCLQTTLRTWLCC